MGTHQNQISQIAEAGNHEIKTFAEKGESQKSWEDWSDKKRERNGKAGMKYAIERNYYSTVTFSTCNRMKSAFPFSPL